VTQAWGQFGNPVEGERPLLEAGEGTADRDDPVHAVVKCRVMRNKERGRTLTALSIQVTIRFHTCIRFWRYE
jgi:hypothetical protein